MNRSGHNVKGERSLFKGWFHQFLKSTERQTQEVKAQIWTRPQIRPTKPSQRLRPTWEHSYSRTGAAPILAESLRHENKQHFSPWCFWPNVSSHSLRFHLYSFFQIHFVNATWSTITQKIDTSLKLIKRPAREIKTGIYSFLLRTEQRAFYGDGAAFCWFEQEVGLSRHIQLKPTGVPIGQLLLAALWLAENKWHSWCENVQQGRNLRK